MASLRLRRGLERFCATLEYASLWSAGAAVAYGARCACSDRTYCLADLCHRPSPSAPCAIVSATDAWDNNATLLARDTDVRGTLCSLRPDADQRGIWHEMAIAGVRSGMAGECVSASALVTVLLLQPTSVRPDVEARYFAALAHSLCDTLGLPCELAPEPPATAAERQHGTVRGFYELRTQERNSADMSFLMLAYLVVFLYISFSIGKFHLVKSKFGLGVTAVAIVACSLTSSVGICTALGLAPTLMAAYASPRRGRPVHDRARFAS